MNKETKYYFYRLEERNGGYEYTHKMIIPIDADADIKEAIIEVVKHFYTSDTEGEKNEKGEYEFENGGIVVYPFGDPKELTKEEYEFLTKFL